MHQNPDGLRMKINGKNLLVTVFACKGIFQIKTMRIIKDQIIDLIQNVYFPNMRRQKTDLENLPTNFEKGKYGSYFC